MKSVLPLTGRSVRISVRRHAASIHTRIKLTWKTKIGESKVSIRELFLMLIYSESNNPLSLQIKLWINMDTHKADREQYTKVVNVQRKALQL